MIYFNILTNSSIILINPGFPTAEIRFPSTTQRESTYSAPANSATILELGNPVNYLPLIDFVAANIKVL